MIARDLSHLRSDVRERIEVVQGSHGDATIVNKAFAGADAVFWLVPPDPHAKIVDARTLTSLGRHAPPSGLRGSERVVGISALGEAPGRCACWSRTASLKMDDIIASTGVHTGR